MRTSNRKTGILHYARSVPVQQLHPVWFRLVRVGEVYEYLDKRGVKVFLSDVSLPQLGRDEFRHEIEEAIEGAENMVVLVSRAADARERWIKYEWGLFVDELLAGRKAGNLLTFLLVPDIDPADLPIALRNREILRKDDPGSLDRLLHYVSPPGDRRGSPTAP